MSSVLNLVKGALNTEVSDGFKIVGIVFSKTEPCDVAAVQQVPKNVGVEENIVEQGGIASLEPPQDESFCFIIICSILLLHVFITILRDHWALSEGNLVH